MNCELWNSAYTSCQSGTLIFKFNINFNLLSVLTVIKILSCVLKHMIRKQNLIIEWKIYKWSIDLFSYRDYA